MEYIYLNSKDHYMNNGVLYINKTEKTGVDKLFDEIGFGCVMFLLIAGLIVNILLIIAIRRSPRLKAPIFQLLFSLAFSDAILLTGFALPEIGDYFNDGKWIFGSRGCTFIVFIRFLPAHVTSCLIGVSCWERFYAVCRPHSAIWITSRKMSAVIALSFLLNAAVLAPIIVMTKPVDLQYDDGTLVHTCQLVMPSHVEKLYFTIMGMLFYGVVAIVSTAFLACTLCKIAKVDLETYFIKDDFKNHILRCIAVVTGASILSWLPHYYAYFYNLHAKDGSHVDGAIIILGTILVLASGAMKPVLYVSVSSQFRKAVIRALRCCHDNEVDYEHTHGYRMHDRLMLAESEPL